VGHAFGAKIAEKEGKAKEIKGKGKGKKGNHMGLPVRGGGWK
jgi:hypothetical protein